MAALPARVRAAAARSRNTRCNASLSPSTNAATCIPACAGTLRPMCLPDASFRDRTEAVISAGSIRRHVICRSWRPRARVLHGQTHPSRFAHLDCRSRSRCDRMGMAFRNRARASAFIFRAGTWSRAERSSPRWATASNAAASGTALATGTRGSLYRMPGQTLRGSNRSGEARCGASRLTKREVFDEQVDDGGVSRNNVCSSWNGVRAKLELGKCRHGLYELEPVRCE